ncbi:hypothetical protein ACFSSB_12875 [Lacinutrix gracilariae]|uniref:Pentapeptide repeat-containing protein n=1 Tax=Lacinutrix gracilariae TaxID=1747198 RepID=A0ABW5K513_9FLAO
MEMITIKYFNDYGFETSDNAFIESDSLFFKNVNFEGLIFIRELVFENYKVRKISFENCVFDTVIVESIIEFKEIDFKNCNIKLVNVKKNESVFNINIEGESTIVKQVNVEDSEFLKLRIYNGKFNHIFITSPIESFVLLNGDFLTVSLSDSVFGKEKGIYKEIRISPPFIGLNKSKRFFIKNLAINSRSIEDLLIYKIECDYLELHGEISANSKYLIRDIEVKDFKMDSLFNFGEIDLSFIRPLTGSLDSTFSIVISDLGLSKFRDVFIKKFKKVEIEHSDLSSLKLYNSSFPIDIEGSPTKLYGVYNDLYTSAIKSSNTKDKVDYYKATQENLLKVKISEAKSRERCGSIIALKLSKWLSSFGTDWLKVISRILIISIPTYITLLFTLSDTVLDLSVDVILDTISKYFLFINPLRGINFIDGLGRYSPLSIVIDFFFRIFIAIAVFELVRSFRKYVRK